MGERGPKLPITDLQRPLMVDSHFRALNSIRFDEARRLRFGRRSLEVAIRHAKMVEDRDKRSAAGKRDYDEISAQARRTIVQLDTLLNKLHPRVNLKTAPVESTSDDLRSDIANAIAQQQRTAAIHIPKLKNKRDKELDYLDMLSHVVAQLSAVRDLNPMEANRLAKTDVFLLAAARDALRRIQQDAIEKAQLGKTRQNPGELIKRIFVLTLAEAWATITGKPPPAAAEPNHNAFLRLVLAAWGDSGRDTSNESFVQALRRARQEITVEKAKQLGLVWPGWFHPGMAWFEPA